MKERDHKLDTLKGFLIILVVLGHLIGDNNIDVMNGYCRTFIYTFHMPLFIFISGYLTKIKICSSKFWKGLLNIAIPLCVFQALSLLLIYFKSGNINILMFVMPYWTLWYLLSLIFWRLLLKYTPKRLLNQPILYLAIAIIVSTFCGLMSYGRVLSIQRTLNFYPFFLFGYYLKQGMIIYPNKLWNNIMSIGLISIIITLIAFDLYPDKQNIILKGADHYSLSDIPAKVYMLICSFFASISIFNLSKENKFLTDIGKNSLFYYLYHGLILQFVVQPIISHLDLPLSFPFMLLYCLFIMAIIYILNKIRLFRWLVNPLTKK